MTIRARLALAAALAVAIAVLMMSVRVIFRLLGCADFEPHVSFTETVL